MYEAPIKDMLFVATHIGQIAHAQQWIGLEQTDMDTVQSIYEECAKFCEGVLAPLNTSGDVSPSRMVDGRVVTSEGFARAYQQFADGGWQGLQHAVAHGGQGLSKAVALPCMEMLHSANMSFALCPMLTDGAIEALMTAGSDPLNALFLEKLVSGQWTGTMNLTEPQAGSDLAQIRTRAVPQEDGNYKISGTKIFITYGDHDFTENIVHLVLARVDGQPEGVKGISLFAVPKKLQNSAGDGAQDNGVRCISLEHKLGIKASPTAVLQFGEHQGSLGYLVGELNRGLEYMFIMMNAARFAVGVQGVAISERAYQSAARYAEERVQCRPVDASSKTAVTISRHPDVQRMLMTMRATTEAARALAARAAAAHDLAAHHPQAVVRQENTLLYEFLVPLVKGYCTEASLEVTSLGIQVHGGMGFIEETGVAQYYRDARILTIYEGTTAIQANDLLGRKVLRDQGAFALYLADQIQATELLLGSRNTQAARVLAQRLTFARGCFVASVEYMVRTAHTAPNAVYGGSVPFLMLAGSLVAGWQMAQLCMVAEDQMTRGSDLAFMQAKVGSAVFYADHVLTRASWWKECIVSGYRGVGLMSVQRA